MFHSAGKERSELLPVFQAQPLEHAKPLVHVAMQLFLEPAYIAIEILCPGSGQSIFVFVVMPRCLAIEWRRRMLFMSRLLA